MIFNLRPFQEAAANHAIEFFRNAKAGDKQLYAAPTGTGKSVVILATQRPFPDCWVVVPREEIAFDMIRKLGLPEGTDPITQRIITPIKLRNRLFEGKLDPPGKIIFDESHHQEAETWQQLELLSGNCPCIGLTATPFRGSPSSTFEFRKRWGEPLWLITYREAAAMHYISVPNFEMLPLLDDDTVSVVNGEFEVESATNAVLDRLDAICERFTQWLRPTIFACPTTRCCLELSNRMARRNLRIDVVTADTPKAERQEAFKRAQQCESALAHVNIVSEGVDLPLRVLVDLAPIMSPVKWLQQVGRITRPTQSGEEPPTVICTNRNILRHAYLFAGILPARTVVDAEKAFGYSERSCSSRTIGLEAIGKFKASTIKTQSGVTCNVYAVATVRGTEVTEYAALAHPAMEPIWGERRTTLNDDGTRKWGSWQRCPAPATLRGFASTPPNALTEKQKAWWDRSAKTRGIDPTCKVDKKNFVVLPFLMDLGLRLI